MAKLRDSQLETMEEKNSSNGKKLEPRRDVKEE
jgi:hypothetical protein